MGVGSKFDLLREDLIIHQNSFICCFASIKEGILLRNLRLRNDLTINQLSKILNISNTTLRYVEQNKINHPFYYWKVICEYFNANHIEYLELNKFKDSTIQEKLLKIRACLGSESWSKVGEYLGYSEGFIIDLLTRYTPNITHIKKINYILNKFK